MLLPELEQQLDLPPQASQDAGLVDGETLGWQIRHQERPVGQRQARGTDRLSPTPTVGMEAASPLRRYLGRDAQGEEAGRQTLTGAEQDRTVDHVTAAGGEHGRQFEPGPILGRHHGVDLQPGQPARPRTGQVGEPAELEVAQICQPYRPGFDRPSGPRSGPIMGPPRVRDRASQCPRQDIQPHLQLHRRRLLGGGAGVSTPRPPIRQRRWQVQRGTVLDHHRAEPPQQRDCRRRAGHDHLHRLQQHPFQQGAGRQPEPLGQPLRTDRRPLLTGYVRQQRQRRVRLSQPTKHQRLHEPPPAQFPLPPHEPHLARQLVSSLTHYPPQHGADLRYGHPEGLLDHRCVTSRSSQVRPRFVNLMPMGRAAGSPDQSRISCMTELLYVPAAEFERIRALQTGPVERAAIFAAACRINALYMIGKAGSGHLGTTFSSIDIVTWLQLEELRLAGEHETPSDRDFSSKGHDVPALYAVLIGLGRLPFESIHTLRRLDGLPGHPDIGTPGITANTGSLGMGVSKAKGFVLANRLLGRRGEVYVLTGDGELQEGQFWESLGSAANRGFGEITVIVDHNKVQSDTLVERVSSLGDLEAKLRAFGWAVARCDGHDLNDFRRALSAVRAERGRPKIIVADTVKGKGVSFAEHTAMAPTDRLYKFHSGAPAPDVHERMAEELIATANGLLSAAGQPALSLERVPFPERPAPPPAVQRMVPAYAKTLVACAEQDQRIVALDADLIFDHSLLEFEERFLDRFVECGIAEQDMVSQASGLALAGMLPVCHSFACFLSTRPNEQIYNQATERTKVVYVGSLAGLVPGGPGHSHQSVRDISALGAMPGLVLVEPSCEREAELATEYCLTQARGSAYRRLVSIPCPIS